MSESILVVEDNDDLSLLFKLVLESAGYHVATLDDGRDALAEVEKIQPQLVLMDIMMPETNGLQVSRHIKEQSNYQSLPILLVSALDCLQQEQLDTSKADGIIYKPFDLDYFVSKVKQMTSNHVPSTDSLAVG